jgi:hypothetical protein
VNFNLRNTKIPTTLAKITPPTAMQVMVIVDKPLFEFLDELVLAADALAVVDADMFSPLAMLPLLVDATILAPLLMAVLVAVFVLVDDAVSEPEVDGTSDTPLLDVVLGLVAGVLLLPLAVSLFAVSLFAVSLVVVSMFAVSLLAVSLLESLVVDSLLLLVVEEVLSEFVSGTSIIFALVSVPPLVTSDSLLVARRITAA